MGDGIEDYLNAAAIRNNITLQISGLQPRTRIKRSIEDVSLIYFILFLFIEQALAIQIGSIQKCSKTTGAGYLVCRKEFHMNLPILAMAYFIRPLIYIIFNPLLLFEVSNGSGDGIF